MSSSYMSKTYAKPVAVLSRSAGRQDSEPESASLDLVVIVKNKHGEEFYQGMYAEETIHYYWENECKAATLAYGDEAYPVHGGLSVRPPTPILGGQCFCLLCLQAQTWSKY